MQKVKHLMRPLSPIIDAEVNVTKATQLMIQFRVDIIIVQEKGNFKGIVSLRDIFRYTHKQGFRPNQTPIGEITNLDIVFARPNTSLEDVLSVMVEIRQDTLPVVDDKPVGLINIYDVLKAKPMIKPFSVSPHLT